VIAHDVGLLEKRADEVRQHLRRIVDDDWDELIPIWRRPGWTTPAEFIFAMSILEGIQREAEALDKLKGGLLAGSREVGVG
jgi:hypothetical protein